MASIIPSRLPVRTGTSSNIERFEEPCTGLDLRLCAELLHRFEELVDRAEMREPISVRLASLERRLARLAESEQERLVVLYFEGRGQYEVATEVRHDGVRGPGAFRDRWVRTDRSDQPHNGHLHGERRS